jgi:hypothetical protein
MFFSKLIDSLSLFRNHPFLLRTPNSIIDPWRSADLVGKIGSYHNDIKTFYRNLCPSCRPRPKLCQNKDAHLIPISRPSPFSSDFVSNFYPTFCFHFLPVRFFIFIFNLPSHFFCLTFVSTFSHPTFLFIYFTSILLCLSDFGFHPTFSSGFVSAFYPTFVHPTFSPFDFK